MNPCLTPPVCWLGTEECAAIIVFQGCIDRYDGLWPYPEVDTVNVVPCGAADGAELFEEVWNAMRSFGRRVTDT